MFKYSLFLILSLCHAKDVILSSGLGNYTDSQLLQQYTAYKAYKDIGLITTSSILLYNLNQDGTLGYYNTSSNITSKQYQRSLKSELGLKAMPCLYCDSTIGMCSNFSSRFANLYANMSTFIKSTIIEAIEYDWDGYYVDFEPDTAVDSTQITDFVLAWTFELKIYGLVLNLWIGGNAPYDDRIYNSDILLTTMNTYGSDYSDFISIASALQTTTINISNLGFGLLTNYGDTNDTSGSYIDQIINWSILTKSNSLSLWASHINPDWFFALNKFFNA
jgi:hypothetical protein